MAWVGALVHAYLANIHLLGSSSAPPHTPVPPRHTHILFGRGGGSLLGVGHFALTPIISNGLAPEK
jgi:hypothetical protein